MQITMTLTWLSVLSFLPLSLFILWMGYVLTMELKENFKQLRWEVKIIAFFPALFRYLLDVLLNVILLSILFWELPKEVTITKRFKRWKATPHIAPKRAAFAAYICNSWLNPFDRGHC